MPLQIDLGWPVIRCVNFHGCLAIGRSASHPRIGIFGLLTIDQCQQLACQASCRFRLGGEFLGGGGTFLGISGGRLRDLVHLAHGLVDVLDAIVLFHRSRSDLGHEGIDFPCLIHDALKADFDLPGLGMDVLEFFQNLFTDAHGAGHCH